MTSFAAATMSAFVPLIPAAPAQVLGLVAVERQKPRQWVPPVEPGPVGALRAVPPLVVERLLGALELAVAGHDWGGAPDLAAGLPPPPGGYIAYLGSVGGRSVATDAADLLARLRDGLADRLVAVLRELVEDPEVAALLAVPEDAGDEVAIAARHGAAHLALAVAVAGALVEQVDAPAVVDRAAAVVGLAVGAAVLLLKEKAMPDAYAAAVLTRTRAEYRLPRSGFGQVTVKGHRYGLVERDLAVSGRGNPARGLTAEGDLSGGGGIAEHGSAVEGDPSGRGVVERGFPGAADFSGNGLVAVVGGGVVVRAGMAEGPLNIEEVALAEPPAEVEEGWEEIVEVSWTAVEGGARLRGPDTDGRDEFTPPWPGDYRVRVHARDRDEEDYLFERHKVVVWAAPAGPEIVHRRTDRLGHRLRGEPEPVRESRPEHAYRWVRRSRLQVAATVTVATGISVAQALRACGADPDRPLSVEELRHRDQMTAHPVAAITARADGEHVVLVEENGYRGSDPAVLGALSAGGRAASMFWNVNGLTRLSFAERGEVLAGFEPIGPEQVPSVVARELDGLDLTDYVDRIGKCLVAVERFTGRGIRPDDLTHIADAGVGWLLD